MEKIYVLEILQYKKEAISIKNTDHRTLVFSSEDALKEWLLSNDFYYGRGDMFKYGTGEADWNHKCNSPFEYYKATYSEVPVNPEYSFRDIFKPGNYCFNEFESEKNTEENKEKKDDSNVMLSPEQIAKMFSQVK